MADKKLPFLKVLGRKSKKRQIKFILAVRVRKGGLGWLQYQTHQYRTTPQEDATYLCVPSPNTPLLPLRPLMCSGGKAWGWCQWWQRGCCASVVASVDPTAPDPSSSVQFMGWHRQEQGVPPLSISQSIDQSHTSPLAAPQEPIRSPMQPPRS